MTLTPEELDRLSKMTDEQVAAEEWPFKDDSLNNQRLTYRLIYIRGRDIERQLSEWRKTQPKIEELKKGIKQLIQDADKMKSPDGLHGREVEIKNDGIRRCAQFVLSMIQVLEEFSSETQKEASEPKPDKTYNIPEYLKSVPNEQTPKQEEWTKRIAYAGDKIYWVIYSGIGTLSTDHSMTEQEATEVCARLNAHPEVSLPSDEDRKEKINDMLRYFSGANRVIIGAALDEFNEWLRSRIKQ